VLNAFSSDASDDIYVFQTRCIDHVIVSRPPSSMLSSLLDRSGTRTPRRDDRSPFSSPFTTTTSPIASRRTIANDRRSPAADFGSSNDRNNNGVSSEAVEDDEEGEEDGVDDEDEEGDEEDGQEGEDGVGETSPLLPIFSAAHLDALPAYNLTHTIRLLVVARCETTLSWDQLRSPQVSQFLLKPILQEIRSAHLSSATEYALMANCLQFHKEVDLYPGNSGTSRTRAMVCELIAIKLLKEYTARELIDALSYDFDPLQGQMPAVQRPVFALSNARKPNWEESRPKSTPRAARISCLEIAIRAQSKRFLAHPLVVQQLEAIWAGSIVFHSAADSMHRSRQPIPNQNTDYETFHGSGDPTITSRLADQASKLQPAKQREHRENVELTLRRTVTLYNPRDASLFKLSRLRVPRYRNLLSTCSFAVLLCLFLAVLIRQSLEITVLEIFFWFWAAGYMLDEVVGFNEQGFSLYIASFWNTFDLGILLILIIHLCLRIYSVVIPDDRRHRVANLAYDILAADAVLLFPRLFSVLDHYRYFSQLLIAFRMMASDLIAIFVLIIISCSGFFVALTLGFGNDSIDTPASVAYALLQILMGFTPAAWDRWSGYNALGKTILTLFLFICHFLVVTILITVLTNSFMAIVQNANEEHQFVFAVNTISMVKSDALFSYVAPTNVISWILTPLRYIIPFRQYVKVNRTVIKVTHFPILFLIFMYEKTILSSSVVDSIDLIEPRGRYANGINQKSLRLLREPSIATHRQDRALDEVFRSKPFDDTMRTTQKSQERRKTTNVVNNWMSSMGGGPASPPQEQDRSIVDRLEQHRLHRRKSQLSRLSRNFSHARSVASDPEDFRANNDFLSPSTYMVQSNDVTPSNVVERTQQTDGDGDGDGDDELFTTENDDADEASLNSRSPTAEANKALFRPQAVKQIDYFSRQSPRKIQTPESSSSPVILMPQRLDPLSDGHPRSDRASPSRPGTKHRPNPHLRNISATTIVYNPVADLIQEDRLGPPDRRGSGHGAASAGSRSTAPASGAVTPVSKPTPNAAGRRTPKKPAPGPSRARPIMPPKDTAGFQSTPDLAGLVTLNIRSRNEESRPSPFAMELGSDIGDNKAIGGGYVGALPASLGTQMAYAAEGLRANARGDDDDRDMFGRLMLARMNNLEEGFREVVHEMRGHLRREEKRSRSHDPRGRVPRHHGKGSEKDADKENRPGQEKRERSKRRYLQEQPRGQEVDNGKEKADEGPENALVKGGSL
jgi:hypothetical protein